MNAERIEEIIARVQRGISGVDLIVLDLVRGASMAGESITQREIAKSKLWAKYQGAGGIDSDLRHIRAIIRTLRLAHGVPIISGRQGYRLPGGEDEAKAYLKRMEREAKARAWSSLETYRGMSKILGLKSTYFEGVEKLHAQLELFGKPKPVLTVSRAKSPCPKCGGSGVINGSQTGAHGDQCPKCEGSGLVFEAGQIFHEAGRAFIAGMEEKIASDAEHIIKTGNEKIVAEFRSTGKLGPVTKCKPGDAENEGQ